MNLGLLLRFLKRISIRNQLLLLAFSAIAVILFLLLFYYYQNNGVIVDQNREYTANTLRRFQQNVADYHDGINRLLNELAHNSAIQSYLLENDDLEKYKASSQITNLLTNAGGMMDGIEDVIVIGNTGNFASKWEKYEMAAAVKERFDGITNAMFTELLQPRFLKDGPNSSYFVVGLSVFGLYDPNRIGEQIGYCFAVIDSEKVVNLGGDQFAKEEEKFYFLDRAQQVFASNDSTGRFSSLNLAGLDVENSEGRRMAEPSGESVYVQSVALPEIGGRVYSIMPEKPLFLKINKIRIRTMLLFIVAIILLAIPFSLIIRNIVQPLKQLLSFIKRVQMGNSLKMEVSVEGYSEITVLAKHFNSMLVEIELLTEHLVASNTKLLQLELDKKQSELAYLRSQVNPHFLYNTLETVKGIALVRGVEEIQEIAKALGQIFRYSIKGQQEVRLQDEMDIVNAYLNIQKVRFKGRFSVDCRISSEALACTLPKMILQPIVENAIVHGLERRMEKGLLTIAAHIRGDLLVVEILDNGPGMDEEGIQRMQELLKAPPTAAVEHVGLLNVHNRLRLTFGDSSGIGIWSRQGEGTSVQMTIPARRRTTDA